MPSSNFFLDNAALQAYAARLGLAADGGGRALLERVGALAAQEFAPRAAKIDAVPPRLEGGRVVLPPEMQENLAVLRREGLCGITLPAAFGGRGLSNTAYAMLSEMVARADASLHNLFGLQAIGELIARHGTPEQQARLLPRLASGEIGGAMALSEAAAGSDLQAVQVKATQDAGGQWFLDGRKHWVTNGGAGLMLVLARSEEGSADGRGLSLFIVEASPQVAVVAVSGKMGLHGSPTCEVVFNHAPAQLLGERRRGLVRYVPDLLLHARLAITAQAVGIAEAATRYAADYAARRRQFGQPIDQRPAVAAMLSRMRHETDAARALLYENSALMDAMDGGTASRARVPLIIEVLTPLAKAFSAEACNRVCYAAVQVCGGIGYMAGCPVERLYRDARVTSLYEGTTQLQYAAALPGLLRHALDARLDELWAGLSPERQAALQVSRTAFTAQRAVAQISSHDRLALEAQAEPLCEAAARLYAEALLSSTPT